MTEGELKKAIPTNWHGVIEKAAADFPQDLLGVLKLASKVGVVLTAEDAAALYGWFVRWLPTGKQEC